MSATRQREYRARQQAGRVVVPVEVQRGHVESLEQARLLEPQRDPAARDRTKEVGSAAVSTTSPLIRTSSSSHCFAVTSPSCTHNR